MRSVLDIKKSWQAGREALRERYSDPKLASPVLLGMSQLSDATLAELWQRFDFPSSLLLIAVGGYGRREQYPFSDTDLLILLPDAHDEALLSKVETLVGELWDIGMDIGHSVRSLEECIVEASKDITVQTALLEARLLQGDRAVFKNFYAQLLCQIDPKKFFEAKLQEQHARYSKFQNAPYKLEPNIKEAPGGLRDLQLVGWITKCLGLGTSWRALARLDMLTSEEHLKLRRAERVLRCCRIQLHWRAKRHEDRILFDYQNTLAEDFGYSAAEHSSLNMRASEMFMAEYYRASRIVMQLTPLLLQALKSQIYSQIGIETAPINARFQRKGSLIEACDPDVFTREPSSILEIFLLCQRERKITDIAPATLRALWNARPLIDDAFRQDPIHRQLFIDILREPSGITHALRRMNKYGVLGRYIPEYGSLVGRMQHDLFHVYTVDEHTMMVLRNIRRFANPAFTHEYPLCSRLLCEFDRPEALYLAALFHDIGKGRGGDHSQIGREIARTFCAAHPIHDEDKELVPWLVEMHLVMSQTAQKQDVYDPEVIARFAELVGNQRRLAALYLLTVADIRGTSPKVWNAWKAKLLEDLFNATTHQLCSQNITAHSWVNERKDEARRLLQLYGFRPDAHEAFWKELDTVYFLRNDARDIAWHTRSLYSRIDAAEPIVRAKLSESGEGLQVLVYTKDQHDLFARICSFFDQAGYSIFDAQIQTTRRGYALDSFYIYIADAPQTPYRDLISYIEYELARSITLAEPLSTPRTGRISRQLRHFPVEPRVRIRQDERSGKYYVLSVIAGDRPGLLAIIAKVLSEHAIDLHSAKIMTLGERAEDTFLIAGNVLNDEKTLLQIESTLLQSIRS